MNAQQDSTTKNSVPSSASKAQSPVVSGNNTSGDSLSVSGLSCSSLSSGSSLRNHVEDHLMMDVEMVDSENRNREPVEGDQPSGCNPVVVETQESIDMSKRQVAALNDKLENATSVAEVELLTARIVSLKSQIKIDLQTLAFLKNSNRQVPSSVVNHHYGASNVSIQEKTIPFSQIPAFRIYGCDDTLSDDVGGNTKLDKGNGFTSVANFFTTFEVVYYDHITNVEIDFNWQRHLKKSFISCSKSIRFWYESEVIAHEGTMSWEQVKKIILARFEPPVSDFVKLLRILRLYPKYYESISNYMDRMDVSLAEIGYDTDNKFLVALFFNSLPKSYRIFVFDKFKSLNMGYSEGSDPFPNTWKETKAVINNQRQLFSAELNKVYDSFLSKSQYDKAVKGDRRCKSDVSEGDIDKDHDVDDDSDAEQSSSRKRRHAEGSRASSDNGNYNVSNNNSESSGQRGKKDRKGKGKQKATSSSINSQYHDNRNHGSSSSSSSNNHSSSSSGSSRGPSHSYSHGPSHYRNNGHFFRPGSHNRSNNNQWQRYSEDNSRNYNNHASSSSSGSSSSSNNNSINRNTERSSHNNSTPTLSRQSSQFTRVNMLARRRTSDNEDVVMSDKDRHPVKGFTDEDYAEFDSQMKANRRR